MNTLLLPPSSRPPVRYLPLLKPLAQKWHILAPLLALVGGCFGILGAAYAEFFHGSILPAYIGAPIIEEALKPSGIYLILARWPRALRNQLYTSFLAALGGICFAVIENLVYLNIYIDNPAYQLIFWRYTAGIGVHALCSFIFGWGINQKLMASIKGETKFLSFGKRFFFSAMALHSLYNIAVTVLQLRLKWLT
jgi:RsiW-degrading membrane proteinase PrsW (M82 family)